jgi:hypothetical protein
MKDVLDSNEHGAENVLSDLFLIKFRLISRQSLGGPELLNAPGPLLRCLL